MWVKNSLKNIYRWKKAYEKWSASYVIMEIQIKTSTLTRMAEIQNTDNTQYWRRCRATGTPSLLMEHGMAQPLRQTVGWVLTKLNILWCYQETVDPSDYPTELKNVCPHKNLPTECLWQFCSYLPTPGSNQDALQ